MTRILKTETVYLYCKKCKSMEEHRVYLKADGTEIKHCLRCRHERTYEFPVYGRQQPDFNIPEQQEHVFGRNVA